LNGLRKLAFDGSGFRNTPHHKDIFITKCGRVFGHVFSVGNRTKSQ